MKTARGSKHFSFWRNIRININGYVHNFELNEHGQLINKLPRQFPRDLKKEMIAIPIINCIQPTLPDQNRNPFVSENDSSCPNNANNQDLLTNSNISTPQQSQPINICDTSSNIQANQDLSEDLYLSDSFQIDQTLESTDFLSELDGFSTFLENTFNDVSYFEDQSFALFK